MPENLSSARSLIEKKDDYWDQKDPSPVAVPDKFSGKMMYHIYGTRGDDRARVWEIFHAVSPTSNGPWTELEPIATEIRGAGVAAPGAIYDSDDQRVHMFVQTEFLSLGGTIEHLTSDDGGYTFYHQGTALRSIPQTDQAGIYDPQPFIIKEADVTRRFIVYTGMSQVSRGDIFLAESKSGTWFPPYETRRIISHEDVPHHNQHDHQDYEWGLEGGNIVVLPNGKYFFLGVLFLPDGARGTRQRVFGAVADDIYGRYQAVGPLINPKNPGENGHPGAIVEGEVVRLYYQQRDYQGGWRISMQDLTLQEINRIIETSQAAVLNK